MSATRKPKFRSIETKPISETFESDQRIVSSKYISGKTNTITNLPISSISDAAISEIQSDMLFLVLSVIFPVGTVYTNASDSRNPNVIFGFGTWIAHGVGRVNVGIDTSQTEFDTILETGGAKTHTLAITEMPSHTHLQNSHTHTQDAHYHDSGHYNSSYKTPVSGTGAENLLDGVTHGYNRAGAYQTATNQYTTATNQYTGGGGAHNNLQPYIVVYMWRRTA